MARERYREIPFNYTSADDSQVVKFLLGENAWKTLTSLRSERVTGRSARLLMRFLGDVFVLHRNPFVYQELLDSSSRRNRFFLDCETDLQVIRQNAAGNNRVKELVSNCKDLLKSLRESLSELPGKRAILREAIESILGEGSVFFDPFSLISHSTDATDWRLFLPFAVVTPSEEEQIAPLLKRLGEMGYAVIPRGAGTGLTGGSVPVRQNCVIVNTEKLNRIRGIQDVEANGGGARAKVLEVEAGVITEEAIRYAARNNLVFATDPTSAWASTIGGNIAENAGGKTAVLWGTAIDNLFSYRICMPGGRSVEVRRLEHPLSKIQPNDNVEFEISENGQPLETISLKGTAIRKPGLWKDITNKTLGGLPGLQKEGTDGIITSAQFVLYPEYPLKATSCLEFFGESMDEASEVILDISQAFPVGHEEVLMALEHFDQEYIQAINYKVKAPRNDIPKAVLLIDMVGHNQEQMERGKERLDDIISRYPNTFCLRARNEAEAKRFWQDRKRLGAIAARTNAFKLNEDIVLPLSALAEFSRFVEERNQSESRQNHLEVLRQVRAFLEEETPGEDPEWLVSKRSRIVELCEQYSSLTRTASRAELNEGIIVDQFIRDVQSLFHGYQHVISNVVGVAKKVQSQLIVIATHMHAGDGNVHVNIPVFSNDREMMERAMLAADAVMAKAVELNGVVSGEHGIGFTKLKYLERSRIESLSKYRKRIDPEGIMNPGKLSDHRIPDQVFTPSFNLLELEARILQHGSLEALSEKIATCVRCGRCKPDCCVFYPDRNLFFHPRNKNLAIGALIEALLYDTQRSHSIRFESLRHLEIIADHCTLCHKCLKPCPVDIDTGEVSVLERRILSERNYKTTTLPVRLALRYLENRSQAFNSVFRKGARTGVKLQRLLSRTIGRSVSKVDSAGRTSQLLRSPLADISKKDLWGGLPKCESSQVLLLNPSGPATSTVFYFPGCGSERLFSEIARAAIYVLLKTDTRVVLPPPYLCCGFPAKANARTMQHDRIILRDTIIFNQIKEMFRYLDFDSCVLTCGTCLEALRELDCGGIFDCEMLDVSKYAISKGLTSSLDTSYLYHAPCHDSLNGKAGELLSDYFGTSLVSAPHCCSEAGTMSLSRPDISGAMFERKKETLADVISSTDGCSNLLTNCPSCLQGLRRQHISGLRIDHLTCELASKEGGQKWQEELAEMVKNSETVSF